jgi:hypothetical protein
VWKLYAKINKERVRKNTHTREERCAGERELDEGREADEEDLGVVVDF